MNGEQSKTSRATGEREQILSRVRAALATPTSDHVRQVSSVNENFSELLPASGKDREHWIELFATRAAALKIEVHRVSSREAASGTLREIAQRENWKSVAYHENELISSTVKSLDVHRFTTDNGYDRDALCQADAGITAADALIAHTGSVLLTTRSAGGRALSVLPPHHVVIATMNQLLPDLPSAYALLHQRYGRDWPSFATVITGPSRTGDIERILVLGAHGPKKLSVILINGDAASFGDPSATS